MFDIVGYALINRDATTGVSAVEISNFLNTPCRVLEFTKDGDILVIDPGANGLATFNKCDVVSSFKCSQLGEVITPPGLNIVQKTTYYNKALNRKGGYNHTVRSLVIAASLHRKKFCDSLLWQKQK